VLVVEYLADAPLLPQPPTLHGVAETMVGKICGTTSVVAVFVVTALWVKSWIDWVKKTAKTTRKVGVLSRDAARITFQRLREMRSISIAFAVAVTVAIVSLQVLWIYGGYASASLADQFLGELFRHDKAGREVLLRWNMFTGSYVLLLMLITVSSYALIARWSDENSTDIWLGVMFLMAVSVPGLLLVAFVLLLLLGLIVVTILVALFGGRYVWQSPDFVPTLVFTALLAVQAVACGGAVFAPRLSRWAWQRRPNEAPTHYLYRGSNGGAARAGRGSVFR
jgi:hypothetical protein